MTNPVLAVGGLLLLVVGSSACGRSKLASTPGARDSGSPSSPDLRVDAAPDSGTCPAGLDLSFGHQGRLELTLGIPIIKAVFPQPDGQMVAVGEGVRSPLSGDSPTVFAAVRLLGTGGLDPSFGVGGTAMAQLLPDGRGEVSAGAVQSDGRVIIVGAVSSVANAVQWVVTRFNQDGSLDTSFGSGGVAPAPLANATPTRVAMLADGSALVAGTAHVSVDDYCCDGNVVLARYDGQGRLDPNFGSGGLVTTPVGVANGDNYAYALLAQPDGGVVVGGMAYVSGDDGGATRPEAMILRYTAAGALDPTFGVSGIVLNGNYPRANALALQSDGKLLVALSPGVNSSDLVVGRYTTTGAWDTTFGSDGVTRVGLPVGDGGAPGGFGSSVFSLPGGTILVTGPEEGEGFFLAKLGADGDLDAAFGNDGIVATQLSSGVAAITPDGKAVVAGSRSLDTSGAMVVERYCL